MTVANTEPLDHFGAAFAARADHDLGQLRLAVDDLEHVMAVALRHNPLLAHAQSVFLALQQDRHAGEQARSQTLILVRQYGPDQEAAPGDIEAWVDGVDPVSYTHLTLP